MTDNIIIITTQYPFKTGEESIESEIRYISEYKHINVYAMNASCDEENNARKIPDFVNAEPLCRHKFKLNEKIYYLIKAITSYCFIDEIIMLLKSKKMSVRNFKKALWFASHGERLVDEIKYKISSNRVKCNENTVIYTYWFTYSTFASLILKKKFKCKVITRAHDGDIKEQETNSYYVPFCEQMLLQLDRCFTVSNDAFNFAQTRYGNPKCLRVLHLGTRDYGMRCIESKTPFVIASCAIMVPLKRISMLASSLKYITDLKIRWIHFGDGDEFKDVEEISKTLPKYIECVLLGRVSNSDIYDYYTKNDIHLFINVSTTEGVPVSIMEAMSFGIPTIATNVGGTKELVIDGYNGKLLPCDINEKSIAKSISDILNMDGEEYTRYRTNARKHWNEYFSAEKNYMEFYKELINI